jgi:hypothetical protein
MNMGYCGNSTKLNNINRRKKGKRDLKIERENRQERREKEKEEKRGKDKGNRRELEKISLKVRFRF